MPPRLPEALEGVGLLDQQQSGLLLELRCSVHAARERVFRMLTEPTELAQWWGPKGFTTAVTELELRVGGGFRFAMQPPEGDVFYLAGEFLEVQRPGRLAYTFRWEEPDPDDRETTVTMSLTEVGDVTEVSLLQGEFATEERLALHRGGWTESFDKLRELIQSGS